MNKPEQDETNILLGEKVTHRDTETHTFSHIEIPLKQNQKLQNAYKTSEEKMNKKKKNKNSAQRKQYETRNFQKCH